MTDSPQDAPRRPHGPPTAGLIVDRLSVAIRGHAVLRDVALNVGPGRSLGIVGETGSGKTVTCRAITGRLEQIQAEVTAGSATYKGVDLLAPNPAQWRALKGREIGLVPQNSLSALDPVVRVGRQLRETVRFLDPNADADARSRELLRMVRLPDADRVMRSYPHELSGGMRQRVMIALALAGRPSLLVADEPTSALDVAVQHSIMALLNELRFATGVSLVLVTHDLAILETVADSIAVMYAGSTVEIAPTRQLLADPQHQYTRGLLASRPSTTSHGTRLPTIPGNPRPLTVSEPGCQFAPRCSRASQVCRTVVPKLTETGRSASVACYHPGAR